MIDAAAAEELLRLVVATPSVNPAFRAEGDDPAIFGEERLARALAGWLEAAGIETALDEVAPGRPNVVARVRGTSDGPRMMWEGHTDTVQVTGMEAPFAPRLEGGQLYGRGSVDDGGCVAAFMLALRDLAADPPPGDVDFVAAVDEEYAYKGVLHHLERGERYALGVAGEPTGLRPVSACKGCVRWHVTVLGRAAHSSRPHEGVSAIDGARAVLDAYAAEMATRDVTHPLLGRATLTCTGFEAGEGPNTLPSRAVMRFDYRYLPSETGKGVFARFRAIAEGADLDGATAEVAPPFVDSSAMDVPADADVVRAMSGICAARGMPGEPMGVPFGSDATKMVNIAGIPTIVFGPGSIDQAHAADEHVEVAQVVRAAEMLAELARGLQ